MEDQQITLPDNITVVPTFIRSYFLNEIKASERKIVMEVQRRIERMFRETPPAYIDGCRRDFVGPTQDIITVPKFATRARIIARAPGGAGSNGTADGENGGDIVIEVFRGQKGSNTRTRGFGVKACGGAGGVAPSDGLAVPEIQTEAGEVFGSGVVLEKVLLPGDGQRGGYGTDFGSNGAPGGRVEAVLGFRSGENMVNELHIGIPEPAGVGTKCIGSSGRVTIWFLS